MLITFICLLGQTNANCRPENSQHLAVSYYYIWRGDTIVRPRGMTGTAQKIGKFDDYRIFNRYRTDLQMYLDSQRKGFSAANISPLFAFDGAVECVFSNAFTSAACLDGCFKPPNDRYKLPFVNDELREHSWLQSGWTEWYDKRRLYTVGDLVRLFADCGIPCRACELEEGRFPVPGICPDTGISGEVRDRLIAEEERVRAAASDARSARANKRSKTLLEVMNTMWSRKRNRSE